jgi:hypothetical protein
MAEPERILALTQQVSDIATAKIGAIDRITGSTKILALNALIEAGRAGEAGRGFAVVAKEVKSVSSQITDIAKEMNGELKGAIDELNSVGMRIVEQMRGSRLVDLSLAMIETVDRCLFERAVDVRWLSADPALAAGASPEGRPAAAAQLGRFLAAQPVYVEAWVVDATGRVAAAGRGHGGGADVSGAAWFKGAMARPPEGYVASDITRDPHLGNRMVITYAAPLVGEGGAVGVLALHFDWERQADRVVKGVRLTEDEAARTHCMIVDASCRIIAASDGRGVLTAKIPLATENRRSGTYLNRDRRLVGFALTPGFETYKGLGWYGVIIQDPADADGTPKSR